MHIIGPRMLPILRILNDIQGFYAEECYYSYFTGNYDNLLQYAKTYALLLEYGNERNLKLFELEDRSGYDWNYWAKENVKGYHIVNDLIDYGGFGLLTFKKFDPRIFVTGAYARHHFRDDIFRKWSIFKKDNVLTEQGEHGLLDGLTEAEVEVLIMARENIIAHIWNEGTIDEADTSRYLTEASIAILGDGERAQEFRQDVYFMWRDQGYQAFSDSLQELCTMINDMRDFGYDYYIQEYFSTVSNRWGDKLEGDSIYWLLKRIPGLDPSILVTSGITDIKTVLADLIAENIEGLIK